MRRSVILMIVCLLVSGCDSAAKRPAIRLVYEADIREGEPFNPAMMEGLVEAVARRSGANGWFSKVVVRQLGDRQIEILVPAEEPEVAAKIERVVSQPGTLAFRILANPHDHTDTIEKAKLETGLRVMNDEQDEVLAFWVPVQTEEEQHFVGLQDIVTRETTRHGRKFLEALVVADPYNVTGQYLESVQPSMDAQGKPCITLRFNVAGNRLLAALMVENRPDKKQKIYRRLGIMLDGRLHSAPQIRGVVSGNMMITGDFTPQEVEDLADIFNAGSLPIPIKKVETVKPAGP